jgi:hypothetical protein
MPAQLSDQLGFSTVTLPDLVTYVQLPNISCQEVWLGNAPCNIVLAGSATPGNAAILLALNTAAALSWIMIPTGGNAQNVFMKASGGTAPFTVPFMWRNPRMQPTVPGA